METVYKTSKFSAFVPNDIQKVHIGDYEYIIVNSTWFDIKNKLTIEMPGRFIRINHSKLTDDWLNLNYNSCPRDYIINNKLYTNDGKIYDSRLELIKDLDKYTIYLNNKWIITSNKNDLRNNTDSNIKIYDTKTLELIHTINNINVIQILGNNLLFKYFTKPVWTTFNIYNLSTNSIMDLECDCAALCDDLIICSSNNAKNKKPLEFRKLKINGCESCSSPLYETYALIPCGHTKLCENCYHKKQILMCPTCGKCIESRIKIHI